MHAGIDWSGNEGRDEYLYCAIVAIADASIWSEVCTAKRHAWGMAKKREFHAQSLKEWQLLAMLKAAREAGMVFGVLRKKRGSSPDMSYASSAQTLFVDFAQRYPLKNLWYDTEIQGGKAERAFETSLYRFNQSIYTKSALKAKCRPSHKSDMVQAADVLAYVVHRWTRGAIKNAALSQLLRDILSEPRNVWVDIGEEKKGDLRS